MEKKIFLRAIILTAVLLASWSCGNNFSDDKTDARAEIPQRIISFAPSVTEILFELGLDDKIVGVTNFCDEPPRAKEIAKIGDFASYNYEMILRLNPDLAIILKEERDILPFFEKYKIRVLAVGSDSVDEILESIEKIAKTCGAIRTGDSVLQNLRKQIDASVLSRGQLLKTPRVLFCVSRTNAGAGVVSDCFAAGKKSFYEQLINMAGGVNVMQDNTLSYPKIGAEAIMRLNPDIIFDITAAYSNEPALQICADWNSLKNIAAVKTNNAHCLTGSYVTRPGPRLYMLVNDMRKVFDLWEY